ncbi:MAG: MoaD/ThiS family protein [Candidatus Aminicenantes bacterium]|nr:MoaD/ThiS family protein [Candidatus Aminicenantes bacterium]
MAIQMAIARIVAEYGKILPGPDRRWQERSARKTMTGVKIKVKFFAYFRELFGAREKELVVEKGTTLAQLLHKIIETPQQENELLVGGQLKPQVVIMINGTVVPPEALDSRQLEDHSVVAVFPMMGGG